MSSDTRRRVVFVVAALIIVALVLASTGCSSTSGSGDDGPELSGADYPESMNEICAATTDRLARLPTPPDEISRADWAGEVSLALRDEATAFDEISVGETRRTDHASFIENTENQSALWMSLSEALAGDAPDDVVLGELTTEIAELTLGRDDLATEMGLAGCQAREVA